MVRSKPTYTATLASALLLLGACASSTNSDVSSVEPAPAVSASGQAAEPEITPVLTDGFYAREFATVEEMAAVDVIFGKVIAAREGDDAPGGEFNDSAGEVRRIITVEVLDHLSGDTTLKELEVRTLGWIYEDGQKKPLTFNGEPWLNVGDEALMAVDDSNNPGDYGFASNAGVHLIRDNKIAESPGTAPKLNRLLAGMTKEEVKQAFSKIAAR